MKPIFALVAAALLSALAYAAEPVVRVEFRTAEPDPAAMLTEMTIPDGPTVYVGEEVLLGQPEMRALRDRLLSGPQQYYERLAQELECLQAV